MDEYRSHCGGWYNNTWKDNMDQKQPWGQKPVCWRRKQLRMSPAEVWWWRLCLSTSSSLSFLSFHLASVLTVSLATLIKYIFHFCLRMYSVHSDTIAKKKKHTAPSKVCGKAFKVPGDGIRSPYPSEKSCTAITSVKTTYPGPLVSLVTLQDKQENNRCQRLLFLYKHLGKGNKWHQMAALVSSVHWKDQESKIDTRWEVIKVASNWYCS